MARRYCVVEVPVTVAALLYIYLSSIDDVQSLLQGIESLTLEVVDSSSDNFLIVSYGFNSSRLCLEFTSKGLSAILHIDGVTAFGIGRDVDVEGYDAACVDGFLVDSFATFVGNAYQIGIVERAKIDA